MTAEIFRALALGFPGAEEKSHHGTADFRVGNKIFATLKDAATGVVKLAPEQQEMLVAAEPAMFVAVKSSWGKHGWTLVDLDKADTTTLRSALTAAWRNVAPKLLQG